LARKLRVSTHTLIPIALVDTLLLDAEAEQEAEIVPSAHVGSSSADMSQLEQPESQEAEKSDVDPALPSPAPSPTPLRAPPPSPGSPVLPAIELDPDQEQILDWLFGGCPQSDEDFASLKERETRYADEGAGEMDLKSAAVSLSPAESLVSEIRPPSRAGPSKVKVTGKTNALVEVRHLFVAQSSPLLTCRIATFV
jgi:hypothetical protein